MTRTYAQLELQGAKIRSAGDALTPQQAGGLKRIRDEGPKAWIRGVRGRAGGAVSRMFDRMAAAGLCTKAPHTLTKFGEAVLQYYLVNHRAMR